MSSSNITSIYIPRVSSHITEDNIISVFYNQRIGAVKRVDFVPIDKKPGFVENVNDTVKACFVHFQSWTRLPNKILETLEKGEGYTFYFDEYYNKSSYWILLKAIIPVQDTMMNNHQIVDNCRFLEERIVEQDKRIHSLELKINNMSTIIRHFIGGLYCHDSQEGCLEYNLQLLDGKGCDSETLPRNTHEWGNWPTTRQGDSNEKRIERIEEKLNMAFIKEDDEDIMMEDEHEMLLTNPGSSNLTRLDSNM